MVDCMLGEHNSVMPLFIYTAAKNDECRCGANDQGVGIDAQGLNQSLLDGVAHGGGSCSVRS